MRLSHLSRIKVGKLLTWCHAAHVLSVLAALNTMPLYMLRGLGLGSCLASLHVMLLDSTALGVNKINNNKGSASDKWRDLVVYGLCFANELDGGVFVVYTLGQAKYNVIKPRTAMVALASAYKLPKNEIRHLELNENPSKMTIEDEPRSAKSGFSKYGNFKRASRPIT